MLIINLWFVIKFLIIKIFKMKDVEIKFLLQN